MALSCCEMCNAPAGRSAIVSFDFTNPPRKSTMAATCTTLKFPSAHCALNPRASKVLLGCSCCTCTSSPWFPTQAAAMPMALSTGTICSPSVLTDMRLGLKQSPLNSTNAGWPVSAPTTCTFFGWMKHTHGVHSRMRGQVSYGRCGSFESCVWVSRVVSRVDSPCFVAAQPRQSVQPLPLAPVWC